MKKIFDLWVHCDPSLKKLFMELKIAILIIVVSVSNVFATPSYSQVARVSLDMKDKSLEKVMDEIERQSDFYFIFNQKQIDINRVVDIEVDNKLITDVLPELFRETNVNYSVFDKKILLTTDPLDNNLLAIASGTKPQQNRITGTVIDKDGAPIIGANVVVTGTTLGAITDIAGKYSIEVPPGSKSLTFSFIGMVPQEIAIGTLTQINVNMVESAVGLNEVVVIGYGTAKKATVTGSISSVTGENLQSSPSINFTNSLSGRLPGLVAVTQSGEPGHDDALLRIRGSNTLGDNSPLIVVDGIANRQLIGLNSLDIESITILKDASAAIYGSEAANGVILVTTKRGSAGKLKVNLTYNQGLAMPTIIPKMADAATYATMLNETSSYQGTLPRFSEADIQKYKDGSDPWGHPNTDWYAATFKPSSMQRDVNLSASGGSETIKYFVSIGSKYQDAIYKNSATNYSQANFRSNMDAKISDNIRLSFDISGRQETRNYPTRSANDIFSFLIKGKPIYPAYWPNGLPGPDIEYGDNPVVMVTSKTGYDKTIDYYLNSNMKLDITIPWVKGLSISGNASFDKKFEDEKLWQKPWYLYNWDYQTYDENNIPVLIKSGAKGFSEPRLTQMMSNGQTVTLNGLINYEITIADKHNIKAMLGTERITGESKYISAFRRYYVSTSIDEMFAGGDLEKTNNGSASKNARLDYLGRLDYNYLGRYIAEFVFRYDGSYIFPEGKQFGFFPGVSLGWIISKESLWKDKLSFINFFKIRGSWGQTGNDRIDPYQYLSTYGFSSNTYVFDMSVENKMLSESRIPNPNVTWEVANQANIGFDGQLFKGRIEFSFDYFNNLRTNILWARNASVPSSTGLTLPMENIGKVANRGFEFNLGTNNKIGDFSYNVSVNGGFQKNEIKFWDETPGVPDYQQSTGHPMNSQLFYQAIGIFRDQAAVDAYPHWEGARPGDIIYEDVNKDGVIDGLDRVMSYKSDLPTFTGGLNINLGYKNFYSSIIVTWATGAEFEHKTNSGDWGNYLAEDAIGRWTVDNPDATKPRTWERMDEYWSCSSDEPGLGANPNTYWLRNNDFMRLKNIEIGYNMPNTISKKLGIDGIRIYLSGINLITLTKLKSFDPEVTTSEAYPPSKVYNLGINLTF